MSEHPELELESIKQRMVRKRKSRSFVNNELRSGKVKVVRYGRSIMIVKEPDVVEEYRPWPYRRKTDGGSAAS